MDPADTRSSLLQTAEGLFAEHGIGAVSLRRIQEAAGQKNKSAIQYHFGSKQGLIAAIFEDRMRHNDGRRLELLDAIEEPTLHDLLRALVYPFAEQLDDPTRGNYIRFVSQVVRAPELWLDQDGQPRFVAPGLVRVFDQLSRALPHLPAPILSLRLSQMLRQQIHALADREQELRGARSGALLSESHALFVSNLVDMLVAALSAPLSDETRAELEARHARQPA
jgi:AcrR family transcriptional regulator